ncbi:MAG: hypothetical protein ACOCTI_01870 [Phycisphaeraceae bacterium]
MRIEPHENLTITLLERHLFGSDRLVGAVPRREVPIDQFCAAERVRVVPGDVCDRSLAVGPLGGDCFEPQEAAHVPGEIVPGEAGSPVPPADGSASAELPGVFGGPGVGNLLDVMA